MTVSLRLAMIMLAASSSVSIPMILASLHPASDLNSFMQELESLLCSSIEQGGNPSPVMFEQPDIVSAGSPELNSPLTRIRDELTPAGLANKILTSREKTSRPSKRMRNCYPEEPQLQQGESSSSMTNGQPAHFFLLEGIAPPKVSFDDVLNSRILECVEEYLPEVKRYMKNFEETIVSLYKAVKDLLNVESTLRLTDQSARTLRIFHSENSESQGLILPCRTDGSIYSMKKVEKSFRELNKWLACVHDILTSTNSLPEGPENGFYSNEQLIQWLYEQVFEPPICLAVFGNSPPKRLNEHEHVGPLQFWITSMLDLKVSTFETSVAIIGTFYKINNYEDWKKQFKLDEFFWARVKLAFLKTPASRTISQTNIFLRSIVREINNVKIWQLLSEREKKFQKESTPVPSNILEGLTAPLDLEKQKFEKSQIKFSQKYKSLSKVVIHEKRNNCVIVEDLRSSIQFFENEKIYFIRSLNNQNQEEILENQEQKLLNFLETIFFFSKIILEIIFEKNKIDQIEIFHEEFITWFFEIYFGINYPVPMFGPVDKWRVKPLISGVLKFHPVQTCLSQSLSKNSKITQSQAAFRIISFWFKIYKPIIWSTCFINK